MAFRENIIGELHLMQAENIDATHAFTTRLGGVSQGIFESLNLGTNRGDDPSHVKENYRIICSHSGTSTEKLVFSRQVHGDTVRVVTGKDSLGDIFMPVPYEADALVTTEKNLPLIIFTADCVPILLYDPVNRCVGACHAGWRGTVMNIAGKTIGAMVSASGGRPSNIKAAIGPSIGPCCFETGQEVADAVVKVLGSDADRYIKPKKGDKYMIDLKSVNRELLLRAGVEAITVSDECTLCSHEKYWSHRYTGGRRGSQASIIMLD